MCCRCETTVRPKGRLSSEGGFVLVAAILACVILFALAMLVIHLSTQDLRLSAKVLGNEKSLSAAETGIHDLLRNFDPTSPNSSVVTDFAFDATNAGGSVYTIGTPVVPSTGAFLPMTGFSIGGGQSWGQKRWNVSVTGRHTTYDTRVAVDIAIGYGPIEISTMSR